METAKSNGDLLRKLFQSYKRNDDQAFLHFAQILVEQERHKRHNILADDLSEILDGHSRRSTRFPAIEHFQKGVDPPVDKERGIPLLEVLHPKQSLFDLVLNSENRSLIEAILREHDRSEILRTHGLNPRRRLLFCGPPGCGKTLSAMVIAHELEMPLLYVRFDAVVSSYLGETSANLRKVFDFAKQGRWVLLFDEFDAIGKSRDDPTEHGELKRVVNSFLQLMDGFQSDNIIIAATNHEKMLDNALWRRFDEILFFERPSQEQILILLDHKLAAIRHPGIVLKSFLPRMSGLTYADVERICHDAMRICYLDNRNELAASDLDTATNNQKRRLGVLDRGPGAIGD